jgi:hypothetical protein
MIVDTNMRLPRTASISSAVCARLYVCMLARLVFGGSTASAGLRTSISHLTACANGSLS